MSDPGFVARIMGSDDPADLEAKALLRRLGLVEMSEVCEHSWHRYGVVNGRPDVACQKCGATKEEPHV